MKLEEFQDLFQRAILKGDDAILNDIPDGPRETNVNLLGVYREAYVLRLVDVIGNDHELLRAYVGEDRFQAMARAYIASFPSGHPNARWFAHKLPDFLKAQAPYADHPVLHELAGLERALNDAFDGPDAPVLGMADLARQPAESWGELGFSAHPTAACLDVHSNVAEIWRALKAENEPPDALVASEPLRILVWRHNTTAMFRELAPEEAMLWSEMSQGCRFGELCQMLATFDDAATAPQRAAGYLKGWLDGGLLSAIA